ncbi:MAG: transposase, partial [Bacillota bacterium]
MERKTNHCVCSINYHIVFCPKYRYRVILGKIEEVIKSSIEETCDTYRYTLIQM